MKLYNSLNLNNLPLISPATYSSDEINELFDLSEEESVELTKVINDSHVAINKVYSNSKTEERLAEILIEANQFATEQLGKSNFLSIDIVTSTDEVLDDTVIYLIDDGSGTNTYNQYVLIGGNVTSLGSTQCDLTNYVTNDQLETKLEDYAKKNEVLSASDIVTTIDENSTDEQVPSAKEINNFVNRRLVSTVSSVDEVNSTDRSFQTFMIPSTISESVGLPINPKSAWFVIHCSHAKNYKYPTQIAFEYAGAKRIMVRFCVNDTWSEWRKVCATSVPDVGKTVLTLTDSTNYNISTDIDENNCYTVKNGICQVNIDIQCLTATTIHNIFNETLPTPYVGKYMASISSLYSDYTNTNASYRPITLVIYDNLTILYGGTVGGRYFGSFSYPVADDWQP